MNKEKEVRSKKRFFPWLLLGLGVILVASGFVIALQFVPSREVSRTVMIYMVGADLESKGSMATYELDGIDPTLVDSENVNVLLMAGGSKQWYNDYIDVTKTSIYQLTNNGFEAVQEQERKNMGQAQTLIDFLNYAYDNSKTDRYDLILWNHGGAIMGSEFDELYNSDGLSINEMNDALDSSSFNQNNKIETVFFGTCLNGSFEMINMFKDYANYLVASEETTLSIKNTSDLSFINEIKATDSAVDIGEKFIQTYKNKLDILKMNYEIYNQEYTVYSTYSLVDLSKIESLNSALSEFFNDVDVNDDYATIAKVRSNLYQYGSEAPFYDMIDLYNFVDQLKSLSNVKAEKVLKCIEDAVVYNFATNSKSRGISIYFPYNGATQEKAAMLSLYNTLDVPKNYASLVSNFNQLQTSKSSKRLSFLENDSTITDSDFTLALTDEQAGDFAKASYIVFRDNKDGYFLPVYRGNNVILDGNILKANIQDRQLRVVSNVDGNEYILSLIETDETDSYIEYNTMVTLEDYSSENIGDWTLDTAQMSLILDKKTNKVEIGNVSVKPNDTLPSEIAVDLKDYTNVVFASSKYHILDDHGNYTEDWESNGVIEGMEEKVDQFTFKLQNFDDGYDYYCIFRIFDVNNNAYYSKLVKMN